VEDHEALKTSAVICKLADAVKDKVDNFLTNGVVTTGIVVGGIFLSGNDLLRVVKLTVGSGTDFVTHTWLKIEEHSARHVLSSTSLREKGVKGVIATTNSLVRRHLTVWLDAVLKAVKLPATITGLDTSLANVDTQTFSHFGKV